jgi:hypothetical protein
VSGLPQDAVDEVVLWCRQRVPERLWDEVRVECDIAPRHLTIVEARAPWDGRPDWIRESVARLAWTAKTGTWSLRWRDRNQKFHEYDRARPSAHIRPLLEELDRDPTAIFWG